MAKNYPWLGADGLLKSGLALLGSKCGQTKDSARSRAYQLYPKQMDFYVEGFLGAANLFVGRPASCAEVASDVNPFVINYFEQIQRNPLYFWEKLQEALREEMSAERYIFLKKNVPSFPLDKAIWFYLISRFANNKIVRFNKAGECNSTYCKTNKGRGLLTLEYFIRVVERIKHVSFRHCDYSDIFEELLSGSSSLNGCFVVCDPPYMSTEENPGTFNNYWDAPFTAKDQRYMAGMLEELGSRGAKYLVTLNDCPEVRNIYSSPALRLYEHSVHYSCSNTPLGRGLREELIITNY